ncbi:MAG TPA: neprosin family prolyl endopeptidase [Gaiellaceae bacterium]|nr:neprosin family prolyl endopeptidase [Gaiellaceae bacterium]
MRALVLLILATALTAAALVAGRGAASPAATGSAGIVPLARVVADTRAATAAQYVHRAGSRIVDAKAFSQMQAYVLRRYTGVTARNSFVEPARRIVDCVAFAAQPGIRGHAAAAAGSKTPPAPGSGPLKPPRDARKIAFPRDRALDITLKATQRDGFGNPRFCRAGDVPLARVTLNELKRFRTLASFFAKGDLREDFKPGHPDPHPIPPDDDTHYYARGVQFVDNLGADAWLNVWSPSVSSDQMSLSQIWVVGSSGSTKQTAEAGWQVYPDKWGGSNAALWVYYTTAGYSSGSGCYNLDCSGFVQVANNVYLGGGFDHYSTAGGTQWGFELQYKRDPRNGNWWLFYRGPGDWIPVGYYPHSVYGTGQLATNAQKVAFGGEDTGKPSALQMGSGEFASGNFGKSAYQHTAFYIDTKIVSQWTTLSSETSDTTCYTTDIGSSSGSWGVYLFLGGPKCH